MRRPFVTLLALVASVVPLVDGTLPAVAAVESSSRSGYWMLGSDGEVYPFGGAADHGDQVAVLRANPSFHGSLVKRHASVDLEPSPSGAGYWILTNAGVIDGYGDAAGRVFIDRIPTLQGGEEATSLSATPSGKGLWVFTNRGGVVAYGDARHLGDMAGTALNGPVLDAVPTTSGLGYFMVGSDGGIFAFGDAAFAGSMGGSKLNAPVQSLVPDSDGKGYWLVASDGGIFAFGAPFKGSMGGTRLNRPVTGMVRFGDGYLMVGEDGGIFSFSGQPFFGSLGAHPPAHPIVSVAAVDAPPVNATTIPPPSQDSRGTEAPEPTTDTTGAVGPGPTTTTTSSPPTTSATAPTTTTTTHPGAHPASGVPTHEYPCRDSKGQIVRVWIYDRTVNAETWAVDNPCTYDWVVIELPAHSGSNRRDRALSVAPGTSFRKPAGDWTTPAPGTEGVDLTGDPRTACALGAELWEVGPDTAGELELVTVCPWKDDDENLHYDGPLCLGLVPDYIGSDRDDRWGNVDEDVNGDGDVTIYGGAGKDSWSSDSIDSGTFTETHFCGGPGDDRAGGWLAAIDGGDGNDTFSPTACGTSYRQPMVVNVEVVHPYSECPEGTP